MIPPEVDTEDLGFGNQRYWLDDKQIVVIRGGGNMTHAAVDAWAKSMLDTIHNFPDGEGVYMILDITHPNQGFTPYARVKTEEIYRQVGQRKIYCAIVLRNSIIAPIITAFIRYFGRQRLNIFQQVFTEHEAAISWLRQHRNRNIP